MATVRSQGKRKRERDKRLIYATELLINHTIKGESDFKKLKHLELNGRAYEMQMRSSLRPLMARLSIKRKVCFYVNYNRFDLGLNSNCRRQLASFDCLWTCFLLLS
jgi:hypothetical protein